MKKPSLFLHYWNPNEKVKSFQDLLQEDIHPEILLQIKESLKMELLGEEIQSILPNFNWSNPRMKEKWEQMANTLILQVQFPENIWNDWIISLGGNEIILREEGIGKSEEGIGKSEEKVFEPEPDTFQDILTGKSEEGRGNSEEGRVNSEEGRVNSEEGRGNSEEGRGNSEEGRGKSEEKVVKKLFETHQEQVKSLKYMVENKLVENISSAFSLNQKIQFTIGLFDGDNEKFREFMSFLEKELSEENWESHILEKYPNFLEEKSISAWEDLKSILLKKYVGI